MFEVVLSSKIFEVVSLNKSKTVYIKEFNIEAGDKIQFSYNLQSHKRGQLKIQVTNLTKNISATKPADNVFNVFWYSKSSLQNPNIKMIILKEFLEINTDKSINSGVF